MTRYTLAVSESMSLEEVEARNERIAERQRDRYCRRQERLEESKKAWMGLLTALGTAALAPGTDPPSPEQRRQSLRELNRTQATECAARGGQFFQVSEDALGTCLMQ